MKVSNREHDLPLLELLIYYIVNILTFGSFYLFKILIKKAILEAKDDTTN